MTTFYQTASTLRSGATTLPGRYYTSDAIFAEETEQIFYQRWVCVGRAEEVPQPGDYQLRSVGTESLIILRDKQGQVRAFYNLCRHRGTQLCPEAQGHFAGVIRCPYHAWGYGLNGELMAAPLMDQVAGFQPQDWGLHGVAIAFWEGFIFVNLSAQPEPFEQAFAPLIERFSAWQIDRLQVGHRIDYTLQSNWKLIVQNYSECYHCPTVHPELVKLSSAGSSANDLYRGPFLGGPMAIDPPYSSLSRGGDRTLPLLGTVSGDDAQRAYYYLIFPNLLLSLQPDFVMSHRLEPQAPGRTQVICEWLFAPEAIAQPDFDPSPIVELWDQVNRQDWEICGSMQRGVGSRAYQPGLYAAHESLLPEIDREVLNALGHLDPATPTQVE
ncbi:MAG TPA: aromatic ring-hydroxylating dioxygenase subunit alpha [Chroococcidiopsis sp.]